MERLTPFLGKIPDWSKLQTFLPDSVKNDVIYKSIVASTFAASLELAKSGQLEIRQSDTFSPIYFRSKTEGFN